jgi:predicted nucleic acid-binding protein
MPIILDASCALSFLLPDEDTDSADQILSIITNESAVAPSIWWYEVRNGLLSAERSQRLKVKQTNELLQSLVNLPIRLDAAVREDSLYEIARKYNLTIYDAAYLESALRLGFRLASFDGYLRKAAVKAGVGLVL